MDIIYRNFGWETPSREWLKSLVPHHHWVNQNKLIIDKETWDYEMKLRRQSKERGIDTNNERCNCVLEIQMKDIPSSGYHNKYCIC